jgi:hypothetical protein
MLAVGGAVNNRKGLSTIKLEVEIRQKLKRRIWTLQTKKDPLRMARLM